MGLKDWASETARDLRDAAGAARAEWKVSRSVRLAAGAAVNDWQFSQAARAEANEYYAGLHPNSPPEFRAEAPPSPEIWTVDAGEWTGIDGVWESRTQIGQSEAGFHHRTLYSQQGGEPLGAAWSEAVPTREAAEALSFESDPMGLRASIEQEAADREERQIAEWERTHPLATTRAHPEIPEGSHTEVGDWQSLPDDGYWKAVRTYVKEQGGTARFCLEATTEPGNHDSDRQSTQWSEPFATMADAQAAADKEVRAMVGEWVRHDAHHDTEHERIETLSTRTWQSLDGERDYRLLIGRSDAGFDREDGRAFGFHFAVEVDRYGAPSDDGLPWTLPFRTEQEARDYGAMALENLMAERDPERAAEAQQVHEAEAEQAYRRQERSDAGLER